MKKYLITYQNYCILFGDDHVSKVVEAESEEKAISKVHCDNMWKYSTGNYVATEITDEPAFSRPTASVDIYICPNCGKEFLDVYAGSGFYCDHCGYENLD